MFYSTALDVFFSTQNFYCEKYSCKIDAQKKMNAQHIGS